MDWYCLVFNSDKVSSSAGASFLYENVCLGNFSLVSDIDIIDNLHKELMEKNFSIEVNKGPGFIVIGCNLSDADFINDYIKTLCKKHSLSYFEPQNLEYQY